jgi:hypothetical protein
MITRPAYRMITEKPDSKFTMQYTYIYPFFYLFSPRILT